MSTLLCMPRFSYLDANGTPRAGALATLYQSGTNTPVTVYKDSALTIPHSSPIVATADGYFPAIYAPSSTALKLVMTDSDGANPQQTDPVSPLALTSSEIIPLVNPLTDPEGDVAITPSDYTYGTRPIIEVQRYGALLDGVTNDAPALKEALLVASSVGGQVHIPASVQGMAIASASLPITLYSNTALVGDGKTASVITVTGVGTGHLFKGTNIKGFACSGITFVGNSGGTTVDEGSCFNFQQDTNAISVGGDIRIKDCHFKNFKAYYWLWFRNTGSTYTMDNFWVQGNTFESLTGNTIGPSSIGPSSYCVSFEGQSDGANGVIRNAWVTHNYAECTNVKGFAAVWESTRNLYFTHNIIPNAGQANTDDCANYAFLIYNNGTGSAPNPDFIYIEKNIVAAPRDAGVYSATHDVAGGNVFVRGNTFTGQTSTATGTLPKGAIALNGTNQAIVEDNVIDACYWGIAVIGQYTSQTARISRNRVTNCTNQSIYINPTLTGSAKRFDITDNRINASAASVRCIMATVTSTAGIVDLIIERNKCSSAYLPIEVSSSSGTALLQYVSICDNEVEGQAATSGGIDAPSLSSATTRTRVCRNRFTGTWGDVNLLNITSSTGLTVRDNEFNDLTTGSGFCIASNGAQGRFEGQVFTNVAVARRNLISGGEDLGYTAPTWTGNDNDFVQNLNVKEVGSSASKYLLMGWQWDATAAAWKECRTLTGN